MGYLVSLNAIKPDNLIHMGGIRYVYAWGSLSLVKWKNQNLYTEPQNIFFQNSDRGKFGERVCLLKGPISIGLLSEHNFSLRSESVI